MFLDSGTILTPCRAPLLVASSIVMRWRLAGEQADVGLRIMWQLAEEERRLHNIVAMLGRGHAVERISTALLDLHTSSGAFAPRPTIMSSPGTITYGQIFAVGVDSAAGSKRVTFIKTASVTHSFNFEQRFMDL